jgi:preprotein translocase subunit SecG
VLITGKGDAMSGGSGVRTTFKGKANFDDFMSRWTLILGVALFGFVLAVDILVNYMHPT